MKTCGTCKYWERCQDHEADDFGTCVKVEMFRYPEARSEETIAAVQDGSGFYAALLTKDRFGCVLWEAT